MPLSKVIWAVDAFEPNRRVKKAAIRTLRLLSERFDFEVVPTYVLNAEQQNLAEEWVGPSQYYRPAAEKAIKKELSDTRLAHLRDPHVILQQSSATAEAVEKLSHYAAASGAEFILVSTHGRSGVKRILLGSFAESLLLKSQVPVIVLGPQVRRLHSLNKILFPTEFGPHSKRVYRRVVHFAKKLGSKLILFHSVPHPVEPFLQSGVYLLGGTWIPVQSYFREDVDRQMKRAREWARWAQNQGVDAEAVVHSIGGQVSEVLVDLAQKEKVGCIVMEAQTGPIMSALIGSVTRQVIRSSPCPVWILRSSMFQAGSQDEHAGQKLAS